MNNEEVQQFLLAVGAMTEVWTSVYGNFMKQGFSSDEAIKHTGEFMKIFMTSIMGK